MNNIASRIFCNTSQFFASLARICAVGLFFICPTGILLCEYTVLVLILEMKVQSLSFGLKDYKASVRVTE